MKEERNIITMDGQGDISLPTDIGATAMTEWEICELFGVIAPTVRAGIKALCKSGVLKEYGIERLVHLSDRYSAEVQPRNDSRPRFPGRIIRGGESPQGIIGKDYTRAKRENDGYRICRCRHRAEPPMDGVTVCRSGYQFVIRSYRRTDGKGLFPDRRKSGAIISVYKGKASTGLYVGCKVGRLRR